MSILFLLPWIVILYFSSKQKGVFLYYFVLFQFIFIGVGLAVFPFLGFDYLSVTFSSFNFCDLSENDFNFASLMVLSGVTSLVFFYTLLSQSIFRTKKKEYYPPESLCQQSEVRKCVIFLFMLIAILVCIPFILENYHAFLSIVLAKDIGGLANSVAFRRDATTGYLRILFIYNMLPAITVALFLFCIKKKRYYLWVVFIFFFLLTSSTLLLTFQKRPFLIFLGTLGLAWCLSDINWRQVKKIKIRYLITKLKWIIVTLFAILFIFYFFYTGLRFSRSPFEILSNITSIIFSRVFGRLSIPAAMYVDYFPQHHPFYGLENVGLLTRLFELDIFLDSKIVFSHYTAVPVDGSLAASVFIDAYGQGGAFFPIIYGAILAIIILLLEITYVRSGFGVKKTFAFIASFIFLYYLSQASLFRSLLGYGGIFYFFAWFAFFKTHHSRKTGLDL